MDFVLANHGSILVLTPTSDAGRAWSEEHLCDTETQHWAHGTVIEPRYWPPIAQGIAADGLEVA